MDDYSKYNDEPRKDQKTISQPSKPKKLSKASGFVLLSSGPVKSVKDKEIIIESKDSTSSYVITKSTKICVDGFQTDSWRSLKKAQTATVTTELNSNMAIRIDNGPIVVGAGSLELFIPECKSQAIKAKLDSVKEVQKLLTKAGYDVGSADGIAGPRTRSAIRAFQKGHGYPESGTVSNELIIQLKDILTQ